MGSIKQLFSIFIGIILTCMVIAVVINFAWPYQRALSNNHNELTGLEPQSCNTNIIRHYAIDDAGALTIIKKKEEASIQQCYRAEDILALNKALRLSDSISLLGILVATIGLLLPVFSYIIISIKSADTKRSLAKGQNDTLDKLKNQTHKELKKLPTVIQAAADFRMEYFAHQINLIDSSQAPSSGNCQGILQTVVREIKDAFSSANHLEFILFQVTGNQEQAKRAFDALKDYISDADVGRDRMHIKALHRALKAIYDAGMLETEDKREMLREFLNEKLAVNDMDNWFTKT